MGVVSWIKELVSLNSKTDEAIEEFKREKERTHVVTSDIEKITADLRRGREAIKAKAKGLTNHLTPSEQQNDIREIQPRQAIKSSAG
jgi:uncharacterized protein YcbK (DUF882 family)